MLDPLSLFLFLCICFIIFLFILAFINHYLMRRKLLEDFEDLTKEIKRNEK